jgi:hypothetical protein
MKASARGFAPVLSAAKNLKREALESGHNPGARQDFQHARQAAGHRPAR